jgi:hypothetical protein
LLTIPIKAINVPSELKNDDYDNPLSGWIFFIGRIKDYNETETTISFYIVNCLILGWTNTDGVLIGHIYDSPLNYNKEFLTRYGIITNNFISALFTYYES